MDVQLATFTLCFYVVLYPTPVACQTGTQAKSLYTQLFVTDAYNSKIRPANDQSVPIEVSISFNLIAINEVNAVQQSLKTTGSLTIEWTDYFLQWTPSSYGNLAEYHWSQNDVWRPDIALQNSYDDFDDLGSSSVLVLNKYNGTITWSPFEVLTSTCNMDVTDFPLDSQTCQLKFVSLGYRKTEVLLAGGAEGFAIDDFQTNSDWSIVSTNWWTVSDDEDVTIIFQIKIKRNSTYDILTIIVPIMALSVLNLFGFLVPSDSGEKVGYNVTVFLAFAVFFSLIAASLPEALALMVIYLILMTMASAVTCLFAIVQVRCLGFDETGKKVPRLFIYISKLVYGRVCFKKENTNKVDNSEVNINDKKQSSPGKSLQSINDDEDSEKNSSQSQGKESETLTWKEAMNATDLLLLYFFTVYCLLSTIICFGLASG